MQTTQLKLVIFCIIVILITMLSLTIEQPITEKLFYYGFDEKIEIKRIPEKILVKKRKTLAKSAFESFIKNLLGDVSFNYQHGADLIKIELKDFKERNEKINALLADSMILSVKDFFSTNDGLELSFTNEIVIKFKNDIAVSNKDKLIADFNLKKIKSTKLFDVFEVSKFVDVNEVANKLYESGMFEYAYPSIISKIEFSSTPNDPYFQYQIAVIIQDRLLVVTQVQLTLI